MARGKLSMHMPDLGERRGALSDWVTQRWVQATGRTVALADCPWLDGPAGDVRTIGSDYFHRLATRLDLTVSRGGGLLPRFADLESPACRVEQVASPVIDFYEHTAEFDLDLWSEWSPAFRPFGAALAAIFSRRLNQLNLPLSALDTSHGIRSDVLQLTDATGCVRHTAWVREVIATGQTLYAGAYSLCTVPGHDGRCVRVVFPLPNGHATVVMKAESGADASLTLRSSGRTFGDPGFYFFVESTRGQGWSRYVRSMRETIHVFVDEAGDVRADHVLAIWHAVFLRLHYRMRRHG